MSKDLRDSGMTADELLVHMEQLFKKCVEVARAKNADYSASDSNAFRNFEAVEFFGITDTKRGLMVRLTDKFTRICNLLKRDPAVATEKLEDTLEDAINYLAIMHARVTSEKK